MLKDEWEKYSSKMINTPYTPRAAHSYEAWLEDQVNGARYSARMEKEKKNKNMNTQVRDRILVWSFLALIVIAALIRGG